jgi:2,5-diamino-6-(ribosylamino)-4(3H)-pyrimidinone 5'-phosphate reductase
MLPRVIVHNALSVDGRTVGFEPNLELFYGLASTWQEDVTLAGSETIIAASRLNFDEPMPPAGAVNDPASEGLLAVVDSRGRVKSWRQVKAWPFWSRFVSIGSSTTPGEHLRYLEYQSVDSLIAGHERVDLRIALEELNQRYGAQTVRVESGGWLNGALLEQGLVDEVSVVTHPVLVGGFSPATLFRSSHLADPANLINLELAECKSLDGGYIWLRYLVADKD